MKSLTRVLALSSVSATPNLMRRVPVAAQAFMLAAFAFASVIPTRAADITYDVDIVSGQNSIVGTITTDGKLGYLSGGFGADDFVSWNLKLTAGAFSLDDVGPLFPYAEATLGHNIIASPTTLSIDFTETGNSSLFNLLGPVAGYEGLHTYNEEAVKTGFTLEIPGTQGTGTGSFLYPQIVEPDAVVQFGKAQPSGMFQAPEMDPTSAASAFSLLAGSLLVLRGRRSLKLRSV